MSNGTAALYYYYSHAYYVSQKLISLLSRVRTDDMT